MDISDQNVYCKEAGIISGMLFNNEPFPCLVTLKKGLLLELNTIKKINGKSWSTYTNWISKMLDKHDPESFSVNALRKSIMALESQREKVVKNYRVGSSESDTFMNEAYSLPRRLPYSNNAKVKVKPPPFNSFEHQITASVNKSLAAEIVELKEKAAADIQQLVLKDKEIHKVKSSSHNIKRKMKRKDKKISTLLSTINSLKHNIKAPIKKKHDKSQANLIRYYKAKCSYLSNQLQNFECTECNELDITINTLKQEKMGLLEKNAELMDQIKESKKKNFYAEGKYMDDLRLCIMELLTYNVGILKIEPVLQSVFKLLNIECDKFPQRTTLNEILIESRSLAQTQIAEVLTTSSNNTLHSDGTTKFGHKYQAYQVSTEEGSLTLGLQVSNN